MPIVSLGSHEPASHVIVHVSDTHFLGAGRLGGRYDTGGNLAATLRAIERVSPAPDALVFTGDLTDRGEPAAYAALRAAVEPVAERLGAAVVWVAGNHDERPALHRGLHGHDRGEEPVTGVWDLDGLRLVALDTSVPGWHHGDLDAAQLDWLREVLSVPAPQGTLLAMHHPPLPSHVPVFDVLELRHRDELAQVIAGTDVRGILAGHLHYSMSGMFGQVPVSVAAATCYTMDLARPPARVNGMDAGQAFHLVHVYEDTVTHAVVPVVEAEVAEVFDEQWLQRMAAMSPESRLEEFSRKRE